MDRRARVGVVVSLNYQRSYDGNKIEYRNCDGGTERWLITIATKNGLKERVRYSNRAPNGSKLDIARRKAGRKAIKGEEVKVEWEEQNGVWMGPLVSQELGFQNRIIEVDCHIYPPHSHSVTHKHNEAIIIVLRGQGYSILDDERIDWKPGDTLYIGQGVWHQHHITSDEAAMVFAIKPLPIQEYMGELNIVY